MADRPVECSHCKKPLKIVYKEIVDTSIVCTEMCAECPVFQQRVHGASPTSSKGAPQEREGGLCCGNCGTSLASVKMGELLGCSECYNVFSKLLISELLSQEKIPNRMKKEWGRKKTEPLHLGKSPNKPLTIPSSSRLTALNEALNEALKKENYEQAAWLRDQIKELTDDRKNQAP